MFINLIVCLTLYELPFVSPLLACVDLCVEIDTEILYVFDGDVFVVVGRAHNVLELYYCNLNAF